MRSPLELSESMVSCYSITGTVGIELSMGSAFSLLMFFRSIYILEIYVSTALGVLALFLPNNIRNDIIYIMDHLKMNFKNYHYLKQRFNEIFKNYFVYQYYDTFRNQIKNLSELLSRILL